MNLKKSNDYKLLYQMISKRYSKETSDKIFDEAQKLLEDILSSTTVTKEEKKHTHPYIFPRVALYKAMKKELNQEAIKLMDEIISIKGGQMSQMLHNITAIPMMEYIFLKIFRIMAKVQFGNTAGFKQVFHNTDKNTVKFDLFECPYCKFCRQLDCSELIHTFCDSDAYCFGNLSKITFTRNYTLENNGKCDFELKIEK